MGICSYCGKPAGLLHSQHAECKKMYAQGVSDIVSAVAAGFASSAQDWYPALAKRVIELGQNAFISQLEMQKILAECWGNFVNEHLEKGVLSESDERRLGILIDGFSLSPAAIGKPHERVVKSAVIRDLLNGIVPQRDAKNVVATLPINFQKVEKEVWCFPNTTYLEDKTRREYVGGSVGVSFRVAKGVYLHSSAFKGRPVDHTERTQVDTGWFVVTDKNLYFAGEHKSLRLPLAKIVSFLQFNDGLGVMRDGASAKPSFFKTGDGWFTYNLVSNLARL